MSDKVIILGSGAAPGVPTISDGWGSCNPQNSKNERSRAGIYVELGHNRFLIDTSADLRNQLLYNNIRSVDAVFYTHVHADHVMGIDDLRSMNYGIKQLSSLHDIKAKLLDIFATDEHITEIRRRFSGTLNLTALFAPRLPERLAALPDAPRLGLILFSSGHIPSKTPCLFQ